jgi:hypothetical protein
VDPVTSETLPISDRDAVAPCAFTWMFMANSFVLGWRFRRLAEFFTMGAISGNALWLPKP